MSQEFKKDSEKIPEMKNEKKLRKLVIRKIRNNSGYRFRTGYFLEF